MNSECDKNKKTQTDPQTVWHVLLFKTVTTHINNELVGFRFNLVSSVCMRENGIFLWFVLLLFNSIYISKDRPLIFNSL